MNLHEWKSKKIRVDNFHKGDVEATSTCHYCSEVQYICKKLSMFQSWQLTMHLLLTVNQLSIVLNKLFHASKRILLLISIPTTSCAKVQQKDLLPLLVFPVNPMWEKISFNDQQKLERIIWNARIDLSRHQQDIQRNFCFYESRSQRRRPKHSSNQSD